MKTFTMFIAAAAIVTVPLLSADLAFARRGADDPIGHVRGEGAGHASVITEDGLLQMARRGRGADDPVGHVRGEGAGHASTITVDGLMQLARRGADDGPNHDANDDRGGRNRVNSNDDNGSGSGRKKPRVPGGSGCDSAHDIAEHASCSG